MKSTLVLFRIIVAFIAVLAFQMTTYAQPPGGGRRGGGMERMLRMSPLFKAFDADEDGTISKEEIAGAYKALLTLDKNQDGNITKVELTPPPREGEEGGRRRRGFGGMMRMDPMLRALDKDSDSELFEDEVTDAAISLSKLDKNKDGSLTMDELRPDFGRRGPRGGPGGGRGRGRRPGGDGEEPIKTPEPSELEHKDGSDKILTREAFRDFSYIGDDVMIDTHLKGIEYVKYTITGAGTEDPKLYFMNTKTHRAHPMFMGQFGIARDTEGIMRGVIIYWPMLKSPSGQSGLYTFEYEPNDSYSFEMVKISYDLLVKFGPVMKGNLSYNLLPRSKEKYITEPEKYTKAGLPTFEVKDRYSDVVFLPLNHGESFGLLRLMKAKERPDQRSIVIYPTLPNEMPRVAGVITAVRQTPLSHVNLRAVQDKIPNAFIANVMSDEKIKGLVGKYVRFKVSADGYEIREAKSEEVEAHFKNLRPTEKMVPARDLSVKEIRSLDDIKFTDSANVGVKAANLATLRDFGFRDDLTPQGFAIPFYFYDEFMKHNKLYAIAKAMISAKDFTGDAKARRGYLKRFRKMVKKGKMPQHLRSKLTEVQGKFSKGISIRARSSTNNEDLPGFSGAGLYDSFTHHPREGHLEKSVKQVFSSLWNYRAFEERAFFRVGHFDALMGVVLHQNEKNEQANGVAVTRDILYQTEGEVGPRFLVNAQVGEDLVTNPNADSSPDEILLSPRNPGTDRVLRRSNTKGANETILSQEHLLELRRAMRVIHAQFLAIYKIPEGQKFAMEIEFKVNKKGQLLIKQARPWVFAQE